MNYIDILREKNACERAVEFCDGKTLQEAWNSCERSDWMLWLINNLSTNATDKQLRLIAVDCARSVQHLMKDQRSIKAIDIAEKFANGNATIKELAAARAAAWDAGGAARATGAAAWTAARAVAADAAGAASAALAAVSVAMSAASAADEKTQSGIIRKHIPSIEIV